MADRSAIEWTDSTFNPWIGCTKVSPACDHCYAEVSTPSRTRGVEWGAGKPRQRTSHANWNEVRRWNAREYWACSECTWRGEAPSDNGLAFCPRCEAVTPLKPARRRVFCASLADVFDNEVPAQWRVDLFSLIEQTPNLDWLLLTKRIGNVPSMIEEAVTGALSHALPRKIAAWPWPNVWLGATICNQVEADRDIPKLLRVPAAVRFLSIEPMLGPITVFSIDGPIDVPADSSSPLQWVICGGESGTDARPMHPFWVTSLRDQCAAAGVPFLFKQWGEWAPRAGHIFGSGEDYGSTDPQCKRWPNVIRLGEHGRNTRIVENCTPDMGEEVFMQKVGKKTAGRLLDGVTHDGYPEVRLAHP
ncbi:MAG: phage Gp37/Gp68 family protein [Xanthomonadaceae bacterium]|nr:phage Gp37/Gp68 family protein [Xanthomonadaceae bacterium]